MRRERFGTLGCYLYSYQGRYKVLRVGVENGLVYCDMTWLITPLQWHHGGGEKEKEREGEGGRERERDTTIS